MMLLGIIAAATAAEVFYTDSDTSAVYSLDTRTLASASVASVGFSFVNAGLAFDPTRSEIWFYGPDFQRDLVVIGYPSLSVRYEPGPAFISLALAYDPALDLPVALGLSGNPGVWALPSGQWFSNPGLGFFCADWFDDGGYIVGQDMVGGDFLGVIPGGPPFVVGVAPPELGLRAPESGLAYDKDLRLFWLFDWGTGNVWALDPELYRVVARLYSDRRVDGAAGSIDDMPAQTPELLVTGVCPGDVYVTVADATPGGRVLIGSAATAGARTLRSGACAGTQLGLQNPMPRFDLVANSYGIASTRVTTTPNMCGRPIVFQGLDVATCTPTAVESVVTWLP